MTPRVDPLRVKRLFGKSIEAVAHGYGYWRSQAEHKCQRTGASEMQRTRAVAPYDFEYGSVHQIDAVGEKTELCEWLPLQCVSQKPPLMHLHSYQKTAERTP